MFLLTFKAHPSSLIVISGKKTKSKPTEAFPSKGSPSKPAGPKPIEPQETIGPSISEVDKVFRPDLAFESI